MLHKRLQYTPLLILCFGLINCQNSWAERSDLTWCGPNIFLWYTDCRVAIAKTATVHKFPLPQQPVACIFDLNRLGYPQSVHILVSSHDKKTDQIVIDIVRKSAPYPKFPSFTGSLIAHFDKKGISVVPAPKTEQTNK